MNFRKNSFSYIFKKFSNLLDLLFKYFFFLKTYRKDTPEDTFKFYNRMKYFYVFEFKKEKIFLKFQINQNMQTY